MAEETRQIDVDHVSQGIATLLDALRAERDPFWGGVNHPEMTAIYPPLMLLLFGAVASVWYSPTAIRLLVLGFDVAALVLLLAMLREAGAEPRWGFLYALNPVVLYAFAGQGHLDAIQVCRRAWGWSRHALRGSRVSPGVPRRLGLGPVALSSGATRRAAGRPRRRHRVRARRPARSLAHGALLVPRLGAAVSSSCGAMRASRRAAGGSAGSRAAASCCGSSPRTSSRACGVAPIRCGFTRGTTADGGVPPGFADAHRLHGYAPPSPWPSVSSMMLLRRGAGGSGWNRTAASHADHPATVRPHGIVHGVGREVGSVGPRHGAELDTHLSEERRIA